jgi:iron complex outermembrane receptor protein
MSSCLRALLALGLALSLVARSEANGPDERVVVRAGFRASEQMRNAGSASVIDQRVISERGATHLEQTLGVAPNVNFAGGGSRARFIQIRGIGDLEQFVDPKHFPSVGLTIDGIEFANTATAAMLLDVDQIEILRGPQGTSRGASALAGMVNIIGRKPGDSFESEFEGGYGTLDSWTVGGAVSGPLTENLGARVAVRHVESDGFVKNTFLRRDDTQNIDELGLRGNFVWEPAAWLHAELTVLHLDVDNGYDIFSLDNGRATRSDQPGQDAQAVSAVATRVSANLDRAGEIQLLATWNGADEIYSFDEDWVFRGFCDGLRCDPALEYTSVDRVDRARDQFTLDLRWLGNYGAIALVGGAYFQQRDEDMQRQRFGLFTSRYQSARYALYGELGIALGERLDARLGVRGESFDDDYDDLFGLRTQSHENLWNGDATLEYRLNDEILLYGTLSRGAKPGGVNTSATSAAPFVSAAFQAFTRERLRFGGESLFNQEIGLKLAWMDGRARTRLTAFRMERSNAQLENWIWDAANFVFVGLLDNVDDATNQGVELENELRLGERWRLRGNVGYLDTEVARMTVFDVDRGAFRTMRDRDQAKSPQWQYHFSIDFEPVPSLTANLAVEGRSSSLYGYYHDAAIAGYALLNGGMAYQLGQTEIRLWGRNLLDTEYAVHGLYFANDPRDAYTVNRNYLQYGEPRVFGITLAWAL